MTKCKEIVNKISYCTELLHDVDFGVGDCNNNVHTHDQKQGFCMQVQTKPKEDKRIPIEQKTDVIQTRFFVTDLINPIDENILELIEFLEMRYEKIEWKGRISEDQFDKIGVDLNEVFLVLCDNVYNAVQWKSLNLTCVEI